MIDTSCEIIKHQLTIARFGDSLDKKGIGITQDAYNLQSIKCHPREKGPGDETSGGHLLMVSEIFSRLLAVGCTDPVASD